MRPAPAPVSLLVKSSDFSRADDALLAQAAMQGDSRAIDAIWDRFAPQARGLLRRSIGQAAVEDLLQDVFVRLIQSIRTLREPSALRSFVIGIAVRVAISEIRRRRVRRWVGLFPSDTPPEPPAPARDDDAREALARLYRLLDRVDAQTRMLFSLRHIEGLELKEIASALQISLATVKRRLALADQRVHRLALRDERLSEYLDNRVSPGGYDGAV